VAQLEKVIESKNGEIGETLATLEHKQIECQKSLQLVSASSSSSSRARPRGVR
jgi:hypothetical protein